MTNYVPPEFVILAILDGWGIGPENPGNAIKLSNTPNINKLSLNFPHTQLVASGEAVGLPKGEAGNTETGHLNLGAGRIVYQDLARINLSIADESFFSNQAFLRAIQHCKSENSNLHLVGLVGAGGVHSNIEHLFALIELCKKSNFYNLFVHAFTDGRDSPTTTAKIYLGQLEKFIEKQGVGKIASLMGRFWAMDRDLRWDRTARAYFALTKGTGQLVTSFEEAIDKSYAAGITDEFIEPSLITNSQDTPIALIQDSDSIIFFNFRIDRPRQLARSFLLPETQDLTVQMEFDPYTVKYQKKHLVASDPKLNPSFARGKPLSNIFFVMMTQYEKILEDFGGTSAFPPQIVERPIGRILSELGLHQLKVAESEKERFVSFYFNGLRESFVGEDKLIIPSPNIATYDLKPEMSAKEITSSLIAKLKETNANYKLIVVNYANADMVGHTGNIGSTVKACQVVDECISSLTNLVMENNGALVITADHGNAEEMINLATGQIDTEHSKFPVPFIAISKYLYTKENLLQEGILSDVAPTILKLLGISIPSEMTGRNLLSKILP